MRKSLDTKQGTLDTPWQEQRKNSSLDHTQGKRATQFEFQGAEAREVVFLAVH